MREELPRKRKSSFLTEQEKEMCSVLSTTAPGPTLAPHSFPCSGTRSQVSWTAVVGALSPKVHIHLNFRIRLYLGKGLCRLYLVT